MPPKPKVKPYLLEYNCGPVALEFHKDVSSRVKLLIGPFGCLSGDTEYLTPNGWKRFDDYSASDLVAEFNPDTKSIEFRNPPYLRLSCDKFYHLKNEYGIDQLLSEEHTVLYTTRYRPEEWRTISAKELVEKHNSLRDGFSGRIPTVFNAPHSSGVSLSDNEIRLMVAISADGHFPSETNRCIVTLRKERKKERLRSLLGGSSIEWEERCSGNRPTETRFVFNAPERNKKLSRYYPCDDRQLRIIVEEFVHWDGHIDKYGGKIFSSNDKDNSDFIQYALATQGVRATVTRVEYENENWNPSFRVYGNTGATDVSLRQAPKIEEVSSGDGYKYCFETSTGFFPARRNGRIFITGNTGKTTTAAYEQIMLASKRIRRDRDGIRRSRFAVIRNTIPQLRDTTIKTFMKWFPPAVFGTYKETQRVYTINIEDREIEILFRGLDDDKDVRNLLSLELTNAWIDEAREINNSIFKGLMGRCKRFPSRDIYDMSDPMHYVHRLTKRQKERKDILRDVEWHPEKYRNIVDESKFSPYMTPPQLLLTTNYPSREHWLYRDFVGNPIDGYSIYEQTQEENLHNLDLTYYIDLEKDYADRPDLLQTLVRGEWGVTIRGKQVYPEFDRRVHVSKSPLLPERPVHVIVGWDNTGLSPAIVLSYINNIGQWCVFKEFCWDNEGIVEATETMLIWCAANLPAGCQYRHIGDPAGKNRDSTKKSPADYISGKARDYGQVIEIENGIQTPKIRRESVANRLGSYHGGDKKPKLINGESAFLIDPGCIRLIDGFEGGYAYKEKGTSGVFSTDPDKNMYSHPHDALQYSATRLFPVSRARQHNGVNTEESDDVWKGYV